MVQSKGGGMTKKELTEEIATGLKWRPVKFVRNKEYPRVIANGCYWVRSGSGFQLMHQESSKYLGYYTSAEVKALEKQYGHKKPRRVAAK
jgi:hypothetical protein